MLCTQESERKAYNPRSFCKVYTMNHQPLNTGEQKDMTEFFQDLISKLEDMGIELVRCLLPGLYAGSNYCQSHVLVDTWMLTVKLIYKLSNCAWWPEMGYKHTFDTIYTHFQGITYNIYGFGRPSFFYPSTTCPPYFYPSIFVFTRPNDGWTGL